MAIAKIHMINTFREYFKMYFTNTFNKYILAIFTHCKNKFDSILIKVCPLGSLGTFLIDIKKNYILGQNILLKVSQALGSILVNI